MKTTKKAVIAAATAAILATTAARIAAAEHGHHHDSGYSAGEAGDPQKPARVVQVTMTEAGGKMLFSPDRVEVAKDEQVKFVLRNGGELDHEFVLATPEENIRHAAAMAKNPDMEHDEPNMRRLAPKTAGEVVWKFGKPGTYEFSCLVPGHREAGMIGTVSVR